MCWPKRPWWIQVNVFESCWWTKPDRWICFYNYIWNIYIYYIYIYECIWVYKPNMDNMDIDNLRLQCAKSLIYICMNIISSIMHTKLAIEKVDVLFFRLLISKISEKKHLNYYGRRLSGAGFGPSEWSSKTAPKISMMGESDCLGRPRGHSCVILFLAVKDLDLWGHFSKVLGELTSDTMCSTL